MTEIDLEQFEGHTKGPWHYHFFDGIDEKYHSVHWDVDKGIQLSFKYGADAKLMASAPELLKEVKELRKWITQAVDVWKNCNHNDTQDWFNDFCEVHQQKEE